MDKVNKVLEERGNRYGEFDKHANIAQELKVIFHEGVIKSGKQEHDVPDYIWEAVDMICHKIGRVANGDHMYIDNFIDIAGYAQLVVELLEDTPVKDQRSITKEDREYVFKLTGQYLSDDEIRVFLLGGN